MGVLRHREFNAETHLDILTTTVQAAVEVVAFPPVLLVDQLRVLPDCVRGAVRAGVH
jgi:hypothetical protein